LNYTTDKVPARSGEDGENNMDWRGEIQSGGGQLIFPTRADRNAMVQTVKIRAVKRVNFYQKRGGGRGGGRLAGKGKRVQGKTRRETNGPRAKERSGIISVSGFEQVLTFNMKSTGRINRALVGRRGGGPK